MSEVSIKIKSVDGGKLPSQIENGDWIDLYANERVELRKGQFHLLRLGVAMELPEGYEAILVVRSSTFKNYGVIQTNSFGVIDESYKGDNDEWKLPIYCLEPSHSVRGELLTIIEKGDKIAQFRVFKHQPGILLNVVEILDNADRGGFGSTGKR